MDTQLMAALLEVAVEVGRARELHPGTQHRLAALVEETGEVAKALIEHGGQSTEVRIEARHAAATAVRIMLEGIPEAGATPAAVAVQKPGKAPEKRVTAKVAKAAKQTTTKVTAPAAGAPGRESRPCEICGKTYEPAMRTQRVCGTECRKVLSSKLAAEAYAAKHPKADGNPAAPPDRLDKIRAAAARLDEGGAL
jgi:hypothetical protein